MSAIVWLWLWLWLMLLPCWTVQAGEAAPSAAFELTPAERAWLDAHPDIVLGITDQIPPALIRNEQGRLSGIVVDYLELINRRLGTRIALHVQSSWPALGDQAIRGLLDGLATVAPTPLWQRHFNLTAPYLHSFAYLFARAGTPLADGGLEALDGQRVGFMRGIQRFQDLLPRHPGIIGVPLDTNADMARALLGGQVDHLLADVSFEWWRREHNQVGIQAGALLPGSSVGISMGIRKDWPELRDLIDRALANIAPHEHDRIRTRWLGASALAPINYGLLWKILAGLGVPLLLVLIWNRTLAREIAERRRVEAALRESQARFARLTDRLKDRLAVFTHARDGELLHVSEGARLLGIASGEELRGRVWTEVAAWTPESLALGAEQIGRLLAGEQRTARFDLSFRHPDGQMRHLAIDEYLIRDEIRQDVVIEGIAMDITEQRTREAQLRTLTRAVEQAQSSIVVTDAAGQILYVNPYFSTITGYTRAEAMGQTPRILKSGRHDSAFYLQMWDQLKHGKTWRGELVNRRKDGSLYWEYAAISPILDEAGQIVNYVAVKEDIGDRKALEQLKEDVDRIMRHDLKTPLNAIVGIPDLLAFELEAHLTPERRELLDMIREAGLNMLDMIDRSLDLFKIEMGQYTYVPAAVDLAPLLTRLLQLVEVARERKRARIDIVLSEASPAEDTHPVVRADERLLLRLLSNLLVNAIEASPPGGTVTIAVEDRDSLTLRIRNRGAVPAVIRDSFFEKYRTHGKQGGTGLGTYSARLMAEAMGCEIGMETSDAEDSTCVWVRIPRPD